MIRIHENVVKGYSRNIRLYLHEPDSFLNSQQWPRCVCFQLQKHIVLHFPKCSLMQLHPTQSTSVTEDEVE